MSSSLIHFTINEAQHCGMRLDLYLRRLFPQISRNKIQQAIKQGTVQVNHTNVTPHYFLELKDEITGELSQTNIQPQLIPNTQIPIQVHDAEKFFLIIEKPAGLIVHQSPTHPAPDTLANGLIAHFPECQEIGEDSLRPGIVHRLDKKVSGLMVIARTEQMWKHLKQQFQERKVHKEYLAVVHGIFSHKKSVIQLPLMRSQDKGHKMAARTDQLGKKAETHYEVFKEGRNRSLIRVIIRTGRTHQIRSHLQALGHPIIGDETYSSRNFKVQKIGRILLHATKLTFSDLQGAQRTYESPLPPSWHTWVKDLRTIT
ncbi:MAG: hypothetical protein A3B74_05435 [Candidatus Kerfeldbacteria bacterium RIFCSPHIGHO2_02_FULL_42_14]|uniref:Pseudouridine synthase n=1 Tax=Candidatus Kerfeldbacteria bacterium RIFCSPHIGHO2_02_FULL_42_14 TaxID=1798540 RepID=A0A1G2AT21_9BACT|nr:MAG: hypothetical protein A3B74_05435 [Candidatus Kerfeldbacteria bacterium RIFCSPHIGHO2_02_FULL_42_14]OGY81570.1 MAG: hypothetical protein A3E60_01805 [Candidatus Kerfeldbacteria bacterium RIFCSPHIGHO2_12_FULL_42_13]OGY83170.1 MAG: hypothetical protein A3I91_03215 [Candidatus Kerfeldbacteria bacterium RIFCSPLOWO2_02_FULL_42_19]OGY86276.1 MAG: hypothetical protein A3G01_00400 [Candidatus Kerfeldbacteria bacterium RIFCSPLOWO2_12_FULL_43_9]